MKKISFILFAAIGMLFASCAAKKELPVPIKNERPPDIAKRAVEGFTSMLYLHPEENKYIGDNNQTFDFFYDYPNRYLLVTNKPGLLPFAQSFLPEYISVDSIGKDIVAEVSISKPVTNFTKDVREKIAREHGISFDQINNYQISTVFGDEGQLASPFSYRNLLTLLQGDTLAFKPFGLGKIPVKGSQGVLKMYPEENTLIGLDEKPYYMFLDLKNGWIYITNNADLYEKFKTALPRISPQNAVALQGMAIDPFVYFDQKNLEQMAKIAGKEIDGASNRQFDFNTLNVAIITGHAIVNDYKKVIDKLQALVGSSARQNFSPANRPPDQIRTTIPTPPPAPPRASGSDRKTY